MVESGTDGVFALHAADAAAVEARYRRLLDASPVPMWVVDRETLRFLDVNVAALRRYGWSRDEFLALTLRDVRAPDRVATIAGDFAAALAGAATIATRHRTRDGEVLDVTVEACALEHDGRPAFISVITDITARLRAEARQRFLVEATQALGESLDYDETLARIVRLAVPSFADLAGFTTVDGDVVRTAALYHPDPRIVQLAFEMEARYPVRSDSGVGAAGVIASGVPELIPDMPDELLRLASHDETHFEFLRAVGFRSLISVPLVARGRVLGALGFATTDSGRRYDDADLAFAVELGRRAGLALDNALHFEAEHEARARAERGVERLNRLQRVAARLSGALDLEETAQAAAEEARAALGADAAFVVRRDPHEPMLDTLHAAGYPPRLSHEYGRFPLEARTPSADAVREGQAIWIETPTEADPRYAHLATSPLAGQFAASATLPLVLGGRPVGALGLHWSQPRRHEPDDRAFASALAEQVALAIERARLYEAEREARAIAERLQAVTAALSEAATPAQVTDIVLRQGLAALGARAGSVMLLDAERRTMRIVGAVGYEPAMVEAYRTIRMDAHVPIVTAVRERAPVLLGSHAAAAVLYPDLPLHDSPSQAWAALPLEVEGRTIGGLGLSFGAPRAFPPAERDFMTSLARLCAQALQRADLYRQAEDANVAKSQFLAVMSHELRTPLNAIGGYADLLLMGVRGELTDAQRQDLERLRRSQQHLLGLINDVLSFARLEAGQMEYRVVPVAVGEVLDAVVTLVLPQVRAKALALDADACDRALVAAGDPEKVQQVLLNLLSNAVKFTPAGGRIALSAVATGASVEIAVADTGIGIPAARLASVFDPFVQVHAGLTRAHEGTGLGLSISRDLARGMGGELRATSAEGAGSTFTLVLPAAPTPPHR